jgi:hypothetical protein
MSSVAAVAADDEKVAQCVTYYRKLLDARPKTPESLQQATRSGLQQIIHRAGAKRRTDALLARLDEAFAENGIVTRPRVTDPKNRPDERIYMFDRRHQLKGLSKLTRQSFPDENSLRQFIPARPESIRLPDHDPEVFGVPVGFRAFDRDDMFDVVDIAWRPKFGAVVRYVARVIDSPLRRSPIHHPFAGAGVVSKYSGPGAAQTQASDRPRWWSPIS